MFILWLIKDFHRWLNEGVSKYDGKFSMDYRAMPRYKYLLFEHPAGLAFVVVSAFIFFPVWLPICIAYLTMIKAPVATFRLLKSKHQQFKSQNPKPLEF